MQPLCRHYIGKAARDGHVDEARDAGFNIYLSHPALQIYSTYSITEHSGGNSSCGNRCRQKLRRNWRRFRCWRNPWRCWFQPWSGSWKNSERHEAFKPWILANRCLHFRTPENSRQWCQDDLERAWFTLASQCFSDPTPLFIHTMKAKLTNSLQPWGRNETAYAILTHMAKNPRLASYGLSFMTRRTIVERIFPLYSR